MFKPTNFDAQRRYPIVNWIYPGPQVGSVGSRRFAAARGDRQALAELGFIVVAIDGMGSSLRSKNFHDAYYGNMRDNTLPDQIAGMRSWRSAIPGSTSNAPAFTDTRAAAMPLPRPCSCIRTFSKWA